MTVRISLDRLSDSVNKGFLLQHRRFALALFILGGLLFVPGRDLRAEDFYVRAGLGWDWSRDARFKDDQCDATNPPALFGCVPGRDGKPIGAYGDFENTLALEAGLGYRLCPFLRAEILACYKPDLDFRGGANFLRVQGPQPAQGSVESFSTMACAYLDLFEAAGVSAKKLHPFLGAGLGWARNHIGSMTYRFPGLAPGDITVTPGGSVNQFSYLLSAGIGYEIRPSMMLDLAYRYHDRGDVYTDAGPATVVRSGNTRTIVIGKTRAALETNGFSISLRYPFR